RTIADLPGPSALRFVQNRLTVEADHVHIARCDAATLQEIADGLCVALGQLPLDAGDLAAAAENGPEAGVERGGIGLAQPDAAADRGPAVGLHKRGVDAVAGRAAHQAEGEKPIFAGHGRRNRWATAAARLSVTADCVT